jgi:hypothetical protein
VRWRNVPTACRHLSVASWILSVKVWLVVSGHFIFLNPFCASDKICLFTEHFNLSCINFFNILKKPMKWIFYNFGHPAYPPLQREVLRLNFHLVWENSRIKRSIKICLFLYNVYNVELKIQGVYRSLPRFKSWSADLLSWCRIFVVCFSTSSYML